MSVNIDIFNLQVKWKTMNLLLSCTKCTCNYRNFARGKQVINW